MSLLEYGFTKGKIDRDDDCMIIKETKSPSKDASSPFEARENGSKTLSKFKNSRISDSYISPSKDKKLLLSKSTPLKSPNPQRKDNPGSSPEFTSKMSPTQGSNFPSTSRTHTPKEGSMHFKNQSPNLNDVILPAQRIKLIMRSCPDVEAVPQDALFLVSKATELFIHLLVEESLTEMPGSTLNYDCLSKVVHSKDYLDFLKETIPKKITWVQAQKLMASRKKDSIEDYI